MKKYYVAIAGLAIAGVAGSYYLVPRSGDVALMKLRDKHFDEARNAYEKELKSGSLTAETVGRSVDLYLKNGQVEDAIKVLEQYNAAHPNDVQVMQRLATLYQYAQRTADYMRVVEAINKISPSEENAKKLSDLYNASGAYDKQAQTLQQLAQQSNNAQYYKDIANLQAAQKHAAEAIKTLDVLKQKFPNEYGFSQAELAVSLRMDLQDYVGALKDAQYWSARTKSYAEIARLINLIHYKGAPNQALTLVEAYKGKINESPEILTELVEVYVALGRGDEAFTILDGMHNAGKLPNAVVGSYIDLLVARGAVDKVREMVASIAPDALKESQLIYLVDLSETRHSDALLGTVEKRFGTTEYLAAHPVFAAVLAMATHNGGTDAAIAKAEALPDISREHLGQLAQACARHTKKECALRLADRLASAEKLAETDVAAIGEIYLTLGENAKGLEFVEKNRGQTPAFLLDTVWVKLAAANGKTDDVIAWLKANDARVTGRLLRDLFFIAQDSKQNGLAAQVAATLYQREPTPETKEYLGHAYMMAGQYDAAVPLLREGKDDSESAASLYLDALIKASRKSQEFRTELTEYLSAQLKNPKLSAKRKQALVYALIDAGRKDIAFPYIKQYALSQGGSWASLYEEQLKKMGKKEELRAFWLSRATAKNASLKTKRDMAFNLLSAGDKDDAAAIFRGLANTATARSRDVEQLLYLWGPRPNADAIAWLRGRAEKSQGPEQAQWLRYLADYQADADVVRLARANPAVINDPVMQKIYLESLGRTIAQTGDRASLRQELSARIAEEKHTPTLQFYADLAGNYYLGDVARAAYDRMIAVDANNLPAHRKRGILAFSQANYRVARESLAYYLAHQGGVKSDEDYLAYFYYAELLNHDHQRTQAQTYYYNTIDAIQAAPVKTPEMKAVYAQALFRIGDEQKSYDLFNQLVTKYPQNRLMRADYASTLVEGKQYAAARDALSHDTPGAAATVPTDAATAMLRLNAGVVKSYDLRAGGKELVLALTKPADKLPDMQRLAKQSPAWLGYATVGYDQALLAAREKTVLTATREGDALVIAVAPAPVTSSAELERQTDLRMQLLSSRIDLETGNEQAALNRLEKIAPQYPNDAQLLGYTANAEYFAGRPARAERLLAQAQALAPENEDITHLKHMVERASGQHAKLDYEWKKTGKAKENIATLSGFAYVDPFNKIGANVQYNNVTSPALTRSNGTTRAADENKQRGELYVEHEFDDASHARFSLYGNNDTIGIGAEYGFFHEYGHTVFEAQYHKPFWEFVQAVLDDATRDRLAVRHEKNLAADLHFSGNLGLNNYNVDVADNVSSSANLTFVVVKDLVTAPDNPYWGISYGFDGEYLISNDHRRLNGVEYDPFNMVNREVHTLNILTRYDWNDDTWAGGSLGYAFDRYGGDGPVAEAYINHWFNDYAEVGLRAARSIGVSDSNEDVTRLGGHVKIRF